MADQKIELMPLDTLHADAAYLVGRAVNGSMEPDEVVAVIRSRIDAARDALAAQGQDAEPMAWLHDDPARIDVIHAKVKAVLVGARDNAGHFLRPQPDKSEHYSIPLYAHPPRAQAAPSPQGDARDREDAERYRAFFDAGLPITFLGIEYRDKASLDDAIDAARSTPATEKGAM